VFIEEAACGLPFFMAVDGDHLILQRAERAPLTPHAFSDRGLFVPGELVSIELARDANPRCTKAGATSTR
jgi:hypothetical protein